LDASNDSGFGFRKTFANNKKVIFSSLAGEIQESAFNLFSKNSQYSITVGGHGSWSFGNTAETQSSLATHSQSYDWIFSSQYLAGLLLGLSKCISPNTREIGVRLTTGLPYRDFNRGKQFREQFKHSLLGNYTVYRNDVKQSIEILSVLQVPQAFGPIFNHILDDKGQLKEDIAERDNLRIGSVNVGSNTVEIGTIDVDLRNMRLDVVEIGTRSRAIGVFTILPVLRKFIQEKFLGEYFSDYELLEILQSGKIERYNQSYPVDLSIVKEHLNRSILDFLSNTYRDEEKGKLYSIINTGGGAHLINLSEYHPNVWQTSEPQWDCCVGYMKLRKLLDRR